MKPNTIQDCQQAAEQALAELRRLNLLGLGGVHILVPEGFQPIVELYENDRKKRRTASADSWSPSTGEIRIYFEPAKTSEAEPTGTDSEAPVTEQAFSELLQALEDAESAPGRMFVALKWFRDEYLPGTGLKWAQSRDQCQARLANAIQNGWILTSKVPNPRAPLYPTTTIRLNRQRLTEAGMAPARRFRPVPISGESLSSTISRERGTR